MTDPAPWPECDSPQVLFEELIEDIDTALRNQPRNLQAAIGPSEIGNPCDRALIHRLAGDVEELGEDPGWNAWVGTQIHAGLAEIFKNSPRNTTAGRRFHIERRVNIGEIDGAEVWGSCDLYDEVVVAVNDWKTKSESGLKAAISAGKPGNRGPGQQYRTQAHAYGRGYHRLTGVPPKYVMNIYLPRNGNLHDAGYWFEPYNEQIVIDALKRCTGLAQLVKVFGKDAALAMYPTPCKQYLCDFCRPLRAAQRLEEATASDADPFGGSAKTKGNAA